MDFTVSYFTLSVFFDSTFPFFAYQLIMIFFLLQISEFEKRFQWQDHTYSVILKHRKREKALQYIWKCIFMFFEDAFHFKSLYNYKQLSYVTEI